MNEIENSPEPKDSLVDVFVLKGVKRKKAFWMVSVVTIPLLTYVYTLPISLIAWMIIHGLGLSFDTGGLAVTFIKVVYCGAASGATHYYIWQNRKKTEKKVGSRRSIY